MNFFETSLHELDEYVSEQIRYNALSTRLSKLEQDDFDKFMENDEKSVKSNEPDHEAQIKMAQQGI